MADLPDLTALAETATLTELVRLQDVLSRAIVRRFQRPQAVVFTDVVGSTPYFARFGNEAGRKLQQRHFDLLAAVVPAHGGRVVDTAGDGALLLFPTTAGAMRAAVDLLAAAARDNDLQPEEHHLALRVGVHHGPVLTDGVMAAGDAVNVGSRVAGTAEPQELRLSAVAWGTLADPELRFRCRRVPAVDLKGVGPTELLVLDWRDPTRFPSHVKVDGGALAALPARDVVRFGRLPPGGGEPGNDVILAPADPTASKRVGRYHFELRRRGAGCFLRAVSQSPTEVAGRVVAAGEELLVAPGAVIRVGGVSSVELVAVGATADATLYTAG